MSTTKPKRAVILARISADRDGDARGVGDQVADGRRLARRLGWKVGPDSTHVVVENDTSAFHRRKVQLPDGRVELRTVRPGFRRVLDLLATGAADGLIALDLDRAARDPRDLEDLIDVVEAKTPRVPVESVTGSLKLANDADVSMARVMVAIANKSSRDTSRRVSRARERRAHEGGIGAGGPRPFGHERDGSVVPEEAEVIRYMADAILSGISVRSLRHDLNTKGFRTTGGYRFHHVSLRRLMLQARLAGLASWQGQVLDNVESQWEPILKREEWEAIGAILKDPGRRTIPPGPAPRYLLSNLALCGHPDHPEADRPTLAHGFAGADKFPSYKCAQPGRAHLAISSVALNEYVVGLVVGRLSEPDAAELLVVRPEVDMSKLAQEANALRARLAELADLVETGDLTAAEFRPRRARLVDRLASIEADMTAAAGTSPLAGIAGRTDAEEVWAGLDVPRRKAIISALMTVTVLPAGARGQKFRPDRVRIDWR